MKMLTSVLAAVVFTLSSAAIAQAPAPYGPVINLDQAKRLMAGAEAEAMKNNWPVAIAVVDSGANLVMMHKLDGTSLASIKIAEGKARTAVSFRRPTKALEDVIASGGAGLRLLGVEGAYPLEGGIPIVVDGRIIGAVGVSGVTSQQDAQVGQAGINAMK